MGVNILDTETPPTQGRNILDEPLPTQPLTVPEQNKAATQGVPLQDTDPFVQDAVNEDVNKYEQLARSFFTDDEIEAIKKKGKIGIWESKNFLNYEDVIPAGGVYKGIDALVMTNAAKKIERGEELSVGEESTLNEYMKNQIELSLRGFSIGGGVSYYGAQIPAFALEFAATAGAGKIAQQAALKGAGKLAEKAVVKAALGTTANVAARGAAMLPTNIANYGEIRLNDHVSLTDKGQAVFKQSDESPAISALKAYGYTTAEVASELSGAAIGKYITKPVTKYAGTVLKTPMSLAANKLPTNLKLDLYNAYRKIKPNAKFSSALSQVGFNGMLEELGEERVSDVLKASINLASDKDYTFDDYIKQITPSSDQLLIEAGLVGVMGGISTAGNLSMNILQEKGMNKAQAEEALKYMTATEKDKLVNDNILLPKSKPLVYAPDTIQGSQQNLALDNDPILIDNTESVALKLYGEWVENINPIKRAEQAAIEAGTASTDLYTMARIYPDIIGQVPQNLAVGTTIYNKETQRFEVTGKSLLGTLTDFENSVADIEAKPETRIDDFKKYLIARRYLLDLQNIESISVTEEQINQSESDLSYLNNKYGDGISYFENFSKEVYEYIDRVTDNLVESGVKSRKQIEEIKKQHKNYIPFERDLEEDVVDQNQDPLSFLIQDAYTGFGKGQGLFTNATGNRVFKSMQGSKKNVKDPVLSIIKRTALIHDLAQRNRVALALADLADKIPDMVQKVPPLMQRFVETNKDTGESIEIFRPSPIAPKDTITVFRNGEKEYYQVSKPLLKAMESMSPAEITLTEKFLGSLFQLSANVFRAGVTLRPEFALSNFIRDSMQVRVNSKKDLRPNLPDIGKAMIAALGKDGNDLYNEWQRQGAPSGFRMTLDDKGLKKVYKHVLENSTYSKYTVNPIKILENIGNFFEQTNRIAAFNAAQRNEVFGIHAALISREATLDFSRGGTFAKKVNAYVPFFNASIQGVDKMWRTLMQDPVTTLAWSFTAITVPSAIITGYYLYGASDEDRKEFLEIPRWQKDLFWVFKVGDHWQRVPKLPAYGFLFGSSVERFMEWGYQGDKPQMEKMWRELVLGVAGSVSPIYDPLSILPPVLKTYTEAVTNFNFFTERQIYPEWMNAYDPEFRANQSTSETAKEIGALTDISPAMIDNAVRGIFGGLGTYAMQASDEVIKAVGKLNGKEYPQEPVTLADKPIIKGFSIRDPLGYNTNSVPLFFENWEKVSQGYMSYKLLEGEEAEKFFEKNQNRINLYSELKTYQERISDLGKRSREIYKDKQLTAEEKVDLLRDNGQEMLDLAIEANKIYGEEK